MFPRINLHIGDYLQRTRHLRAAHHGAFLLLVFYYWANGRFPQEDEQLATIACMDMREWKKHKRVIQEMFEPGWRLAWLEADLKDAAAARDRRSKAGQTGNKKRWGKDRYTHADRHSLGFGSHHDRNAIADGSRPHATCHSEEPEQERTCSEEGDVTGSGVIQLRRERG
jgi:uncharacterized protein YdaU (DUF1376 family)